MQLQPILVFDDFPERVLMDDLVVGIESVDIAALIIQILTVGPFAAYRPQRDGAVAGEDVLLVLPAHVGDLLEAIGERPEDRRLAPERAADRLRAARQAEHTVFGEAIDNARNIAAVEGGRNLPHPLNCDSHFLLLS